MRTRITAGLVAVLAGVGLAAGQPKPADPGPAPKFLYGHDLKVRPGGEKDFPKAAKVGVEVYGHEVADGDAKRAFAVAVTEAGGLAVFPAGPVGGDKRCKLATGHDVLVRAADEPGFTQKTKAWGVEVFRDLASNRLLLVTEARAVASAPDPGVAGAAPKFERLYGANLKVRAPDEKTFEKAKRFGVEVVRAEVTGGLLYVTETGAVAAAPPPTAAVDTSKVADPRSAYGLVLKVRGADEPAFTDQSKRVGLEVYEDPNAGTLVYVSEAGSVAAAPAAKLADAKGVTWLGGMNLPARKGGEKEFDKAKKYAVEVFRDNRTGNLLFVSETGAIAVLGR